jgi:hypothetical protein
MEPHDNRNVEEIVRLVIQRLGESGIARSSYSPVSAQSEWKASESDSGFQQAAQLIVPGRVVSLADIQDRLDNVRTIQIAASALLTPAVKDELKRRSISVVRAQGKSTQDNATGVAGDNGNQHRLRVFLPSTKPINWNVWRNGCQVIQAILTDSTRPVTDVANDILNDWQDTDKSIWCTPQPFAALIAFSISAPKKGMRALGLSEPGDLLQAVNEAQPNLLVLDDRRWTAHQIFNLSKNWMFISQDHPR